MLTVWGRTNSVNVQKVLWCCGELGLPFKRIDAGAQYGVNNTPEYKRMNPTGRVPLIDDDGFLLWESQAIVRYLTRKHDDGGLWPTDPLVCASSDRWMDWNSTWVWQSMRIVFWNLVRTPPEKRDMPAVQAALTRLTGDMALLDAQMDGRDYVASERLTIGDLALGPTVQRWFNLPIERPPYPQLERYYRLLQERPAFLKHVELPLS